MQVRVDFVDTSMLAPVQGKCSQQSLSVAGTIWPLGVSNFCGRNSDQQIIGSKMRVNRLSNQHCC